MNGGFFTEFPRHKGTIQKHVIISEVNRRLYEGKWLVEGNVIIQGLLSKPQHFSNTFKNIKQKRDLIEIYDPDEPLTAKNRKNTDVDGRSSKCKGFNYKDS